jgi:hypothetical protein
VGEQEVRVDKVALNLDVMIDFSMEMRIRVMNYG